MSGSSGEVLLEVTDGVAVVTLNAPQRRNALTPAMATELIATDLRVVARDARLICGFLKRGIHPGGGHFVLLSRLVGREAAAAMVLFGEEVDGETAVRLGLAWETLDDDAVDARALELASRVAKDPALARLTVANFRKETGPPGVSWEIATQFERPAQMWSMRRPTP